MKIEEANVRQWCEKKTMRLSGRPVSYRVTTEEIPFCEGGKAVATAVTYTYQKDGEDDKKRPVLFAYNGGPGSSSVWVHLGLLGPVRVKMRPGDADGWRGDSEVNPSVSGPYELEENPYCPLDEADVVLLDPPGCGFGRILDENGAGACFGVTQDAECAAQIIERWLVRQGRYSSPKYLLGESYGTVRTCMLLRELMGGPMATSHRLLSVPVDGVIMMGTAIHLAPMGNEIRVPECILQLIGMTATRLYHRPLTAEERDAWEKKGLPALSAAAGFGDGTAEALWEFAAKRYLPALFLGNDQNEAEREELACCLSLLTGIDAASLKRRGLCLSAEEFRRECLGGAGLEAGAYDSRYTMPVRTGAFWDPVADDPAMGQYTPVYIGAMNGAMRPFLGIAEEITAPYCGIDFVVNGRWDYGTPEKPEQCLEAAMRRNPGMRALFMTGLYDLVTPPGNVRYLVSHQTLPRERVTVREYASGHMPYMGREAAEHVSRDLRAFLAGKSL